MEENSLNNFKPPLILEAKIGQGISDFTKKMAEEASIRNQDIVADFNGAGLLCKPGDSPESVEKQYKDWLNQPLSEIEKNKLNEKLAQNEKSETERIERLNGLMSDLKENKVDFSTDQKTAVWLRKLFENTGNDYIRIKEILPYLKEKGYSSENLPAAGEDVSLKDWFASIDDKNEAYKHLVNYAILAIEDGWLSPFFIAMDAVTEKFPEA